MERVNQAIRIAQEAAEAVGEFFDMISERRREEILSNLEKKPEIVKVAICISEALTPGRNQSYPQWLTPTDIEVVRGRRPLHWASDATLLHITRFTKIAERYS